MYAALSDLTERTRFDRSGIFIGVYKYEILLRSDLADSVLGQLSLDISYRNLSFLLLNLSRRITRSIQYQVTDIRRRVSIEITRPDCKSFGIKHITRTECVVPWICQFR